MLFTLPILLESFILVLALCVDSFVASFAYGTNKVKIPLSSLMIMNCLSSGILIIGLFLGSLITPLLPEGLVSLISFFILFILGIVKLFDSSLKVLIQKFQSGSKNVQFSVRNIKFILTVYADPNTANADQSNTLSPAEAVSLGIALSLDSAVVGLGAGVSSNAFLTVLILSFLIGCLAVFSGGCLGRKIAEKTDLNLSWISGALLILLAVMNFI